MFHKGWVGKYHKPYLDVLDKKCAVMNCPNYKDEGCEGQCVTCFYSKPKRMTDKEMAVVRKVLCSSVDQEDEKLLKEFDEEESKRVEREMEKHDKDNEEMNKLIRRN